MPKSFAEIRVLLIQARTGFEMQQQEQACFLERCRLQPDQLRAVSVLREPLHPDLLDGVDAVMLGGAGEYSACDDHPWTGALHAFCRAAAERAVPTFGSCWGHQVIARAFGGAVVHDPERAELGAGEVGLTDAGQADELFRTYPPRFRVNMGHHDRVIELPPGGIELARNESQPFQAFRLDGRPVYGTQFHSELDAQRTRERLIAYRSYYEQHFGSEAAFQAVLDSLLSTSDADHLLHDFLLRFVAAPA